MTKLIIKLFLPEQLSGAKVQMRAGILAGTVGIILNALLFAAKLFAGTVSGSIAVTADAFNNLSDAASSVVTLAGAGFSAKPADDEHPFGHGRIEYISALIVTFLIFLMGAELIKSSVQRIIKPAALNFDTTAALILVASIFVKLWISYFDSRLNKRVGSPAIGAAVTDALSDTASTSVSLIALVASRYTSFSLDGYLGVAVALLIFAAGVKILKECLSPLLGKAPDKELSKAVKEKIVSYDGVIGVHDLIIHDYGPGRVFASAHAEVPADVDIMVSHDAIDNIEHDIKHDMGINMVLHLDPVTVGDKHWEYLYEKTREALVQVDDKLQMHDFRIVKGATHENLIFDVVVPHKYKTNQAELTRLIEEKLSAQDKKLCVMITIEESYT